MLYDIRELNEVSMNIKNPCQNKCSGDAPDRICPGCYRTLEEVRDWNGLNNSEKLFVLTEGYKRKLVKLMEKHKKIN